MAAHAGAKRKLSQASSGSEESSDSYSGDEGDQLIDAYPDGEPVRRDARGRITPRVHVLPGIPRHEAERGFAPVRFSRKYEMPASMVEQIQGKSAAAVLGTPRYPTCALSVNKDAWSKALRFVDTMSLRAFATCCSTFAVVARSVLSKRLVKHPFITETIHLSDMQYGAFAKAVRGRQNLFISGEAGSGKTVLLRTIVDTLRRTDADTGETYTYQYFAEIEELRKKKDRDYSQDARLIVANQRKMLNVLVVAPTGTAAEVCGGRTSASVFGNAPVEVVSDWEDYRTPFGRGDPEAVQEADVLIWDEVSMISRQGLEHADRVARQFRRKPDRLFGGLQVVFFGDFAQLPPVAKGPNPPAELSQRCFMSPVWRKLFGDPFDINAPNSVLLPCSMRQGAEHASFIKCLRELRAGKPSSVLSSLVNERMYDTLRARNDPCLLMPSVVIASTNEHVNRVNEDALRFLTVMQHAEQHAYASWLNRARAQPYSSDVVDMPAITMVTGARVSLTRNALFYHLSNGSIGSIVGFADMLNQGCLKRIVSGNLLFLSNLRYTVKERVTGELRVKCPAMPGQPYTLFPIVEFCSQPGKHYVVAYWSTPISITKKEEKRDGKLTRYEVPLRISFAQSGHRCQGGTIPKDVAARVQLSDAFIPELIYVILSRVCSPAQLIITGAPEYARFYGPYARTTMCPETKRFLGVQDIRLQHMLLEREKQQIERALLERRLARSSGARPDQANRKPGS